MEKGFLKDLLRWSKTVYSFKELTLLWPTANVTTIRSRIHYYVKNHELYHLRRGLYAKDKNYDRLEVATKIFTPSYVSFETVLVKAGIIFQYYSSIFVASYQSKTIICDQQQYVFRTIKSSILTNSLGIELLENYSIATPERAFLDMLYIHKNYYFDNLTPLNWSKIKEILPVYDSQVLENIVNELYKKWKEQNDD